MDKLYIVIPAYNECEFQSNGKTPFCKTHSHQIHDDSKDLYIPGIG